MDVLKVLSCNVKGLAEKIKRKQVFNYLKQKWSDVVFMQETHTCKSQQKVWKSAWRGTTIFSHGESNARGMAILFSQDLNAHILWTKTDSMGRYVFVKAKIDETVYMFCNCYAPNEDDSTFFVEIINELGNIVNVDITIWGGDFNKSLSSDDKLGKYYETKSAQLLNQFTVDQNWTDIWRYFNPEIQQYTFFKRKPVIRLRIDYFLIPDGHIDLCQTCEIWTGYLSDHSFVYLELSIQNNIRGQGFWKMNTSCLEQKEYVDEVNNLIEKAKEWKLDPCLKVDVLKNNVINYTKDFCKKWASEKSIIIKGLQHRIESLSKKLAMINLKSNNAISLIEKINCKLDSMKEELNKYDKDKVRGQFIRSRVRWTELSERNTKYYFNLEKSKGKSKCMAKIETDQGETVTDPDLILQEQAAFYKNLYTEDPTVKYDMGSTDKQLDATQKILTDSEITLDELKLAIREMDRNKCPGPDSIPAEFYKVFFTRLQDLLLDSFKYGYELGRLHSSARFGIISLIPKKNKQRKFLRHWRPISLLNVDYKILAKIFGNRIWLVLSDTIGEDQTGFIKGKSGTQNIRTLIDILEYTWAKQIPGLIISVDFQKAFDRVNYNALYAILRAFGFGNIFVKWIQLLFTDFNLCTMNNG